MRCGGRNEDTGIVALLRRAVLVLHLTQEGRDKGALDQVQPAEGGSGIWTTRFFGWSSAWWGFFSSFSCFAWPAAGKVRSQVRVAVEGFAGGSAASLG